MKLDVRNLQIAPFGQKESFNLEFFNEELDEEILAERTKGEIVLTKLENEIVAHFKGVSKVKIYCDRCLGEFTIELPLDFKQEYLFTGQSMEDGQLPVESDGQIDVIEPIRQEIISQIPVKRLCEKDCKGICPKCGENLNVNKCKCRKVTKG